MATASDKQAGRDLFEHEWTANELGLGTPHSPQAKPFHKAGLADTTQPDLDSRQFRRLFAFVDTLPKPVKLKGELADEGKKLFGTLGCVVCHQESLAGVSGLYSDLLLYKLDHKLPNGGDGYGAEPPAEFKRPDTIPEQREWRTPPLWGVADSSPYWHDGSAATLGEAIQKHNGDARTVKAAFNKLPGTDKAALLAFLKSLKAQPEAAPAPSLASKR